LLVGDRGDAEDGGSRCPGIAAGEETAYRESARGAKRRIDRGRRLPFGPPSGDLVIVSGGSGPTAHRATFETHKNPSPDPGRLSIIARAAFCLTHGPSRFRDMQTSAYRVASPPSAVQVETTTFDPS